MIEYRDIVGKRVILIIADEDEATLIPGISKLDEEAFMFQIHPDKEYVYDGWNEDDFIGVGCESFENEIIFKLKPNHDLFKKFNTEYMIVLR